MTVEERLEHLEKRLQQAETDIINLANVLGKFSEGVAKLQSVQKETLVVLSQILPKKSQGRVQ